MQFGFLDLLTLIGALGFFIFGMKVMSEGIQKIAGNRLRQILSSITNNRFTGVLTGLGITSLIQSSSATTVMIVSFVNAGLLSLRQSIGVIMGANIGTTMTAWLIALLGFSKFSITSYSLPIIAIAFPLLFARNQQYRYLSEFMIGFALLFMGLGALKDSVPELTVEQLQDLKTLAEYGFASTVLFVAIGTVLTVVVQSSSAAMALTLAMCANGLPVELGAAIVLGENIGTTITANLAAIIGNSNAKRSARAHFIFNIFGVIWMLLLFNWFVHGIAGIAESLGWWGNPFVNPDDQEATTRTLALFHTTFNIINTSLLFWFVPLIERAVKKMVPDKKEKLSLKYLSSQVLDTPEMAIVAARNEIIRFLEVCRKAFDNLDELTKKSKEDNFNKVLKKIDKQESEINRYHKEITKFLVKLNQKPLNKDLAKRIQQFISISNNLENIGDLINTLAISYGKSLSEGITIPKGMSDSISKFVSTTKSQLKTVYEQFKLDVESDIDELWKAHDILREEEIFNLEPEAYQDIENNNIPMEMGIELAKFMMWAEQISFKVMNILKSLAANPLKPESLD